MKERPLIVTTELIPKILDGSKTQTRRVNKLANKLAQSYEHCWVHFNKRYNWWEFKGRSDISGYIEPFVLKCPYGQVGDRLWVKETFMFKKGADCREFCIGTPQEVWLGKPPHFIYRADNTQEVKEYSSWYKWRSPLFMPRYASRITLEITGIRVERLQEITEEDAIAEGIGKSSWEYDIAPYRSYIHKGVNAGRSIAVAAYMDLWNFLNAKRGYSWESNCWVWVIDFKNL